MAQQFQIGDQWHEWIYASGGTRYGQWHIPFITPSGIEGEVIVADKDYRPEYVARLIAPIAATAEAVQALQQGPE